MSNDPAYFVMVDSAPQPAAMQPPQSELQGAFTMGGTKAKPRIVIDMSAALTIAQDMVRDARSKAFAKNDAATVLAIQSRDDAGLTKARENGDYLRSAPADKRLVDADTPEALLAAVAAIIAEMGAP